MAAKTTKKEKRGFFEDLVMFTPRDGGKTVELQLSPSKWAQADEWVDGLRAESQRIGKDKDGKPVVVSTHTEGWLNIKMTHVACLLAAQEAGLMPPSFITLEAIAEMINLYEVEIPGEGEDSSDGENPTAGAPEV